VSLKQHFDAVRDRETAGILGQFRGVLGTLSLPAVFGRVATASLPAVGFAAGELAKALHPESPGGVGLTRTEARAIARGAAERLEHGLLDEFLGDLRPDADLVVEDEEPKAKRGRKAKEPESEPKTPVTTEPTEPKAE
jgi:hypothetical protein